MPNFLKPYYDTEGPGGLPMKDKQAQSLDLRLKKLPSDDVFSFRRLTFTRGITETQPGDRSEVSWITEQTPDRMGDVVLAGGMDDSHFQLNPIVTLNHCYWQPPVGRSLWRRKMREGSLHGIKAKTHYPPRPDKWTEPMWLPDYAYELVKADLLLGKSIGFFPLRVRTPSADEIQQTPAWANVRHVIEEWLLAEYACCFLPVQPNAVVTEKSQALGLQSQGDALSGGMPSPGLAGFTTLREIEKNISRSLQQMKYQPIIDAAIQHCWSQSLGRV